MSQPTGHRLLPHTADMGLEAWAPTVERVYMEAAQALRELIYGELAVPVEQAVEIRVEAEDQAELLVAWLNEILYTLETKELTPAAFRIVDYQETQLHAIIYGDRYQPDLHPVQRQAKAVTYHQLLLEQTSVGWHARVYIDL